MSIAEAKTASEPPPPLEKEEASDGSSGDDATLPVQVTVDHRRKKELLAKVAECQSLDFTPLQDFHVSTIVPIPNQYYWDVVENEDEEQEIPLSVKIWHNTIATAFSLGQTMMGTAKEVGEWTEKNVLKPIVASLGVALPGLTYEQHEEAMNDDSARAVEESIKNETTQVEDGKKEEKTRKKGDKKKASKKKSKKETPKETVTPSN